jgi:type VI secretion system protein ImpB
MAESIQHKLDRVRPPRVQLTYDVETGGAIQMKELPFVMGILADLSGKPVDAPPLVRDRKFVEIDRDSFNDVMSSIRPRLAYSVDNKLTNDGSMLGVELFFNSMDDFSPVNVVKQIPALAKLYEARVRLNDLLAKLDGNDDLDRLLNDVIANTDTRTALLKDLAPTDAAAAPTDNPAPAGS